jgi:uncharacterized protein YaiI (UPF0178 family)
MTVFIDADGCPVVDITIRLSKQAGVACTIICDTSHVFEKEGANTITVSKGDNSADFVLVNMVAKGDIVVTQDYGVAAMGLARGAIPISQNGMVYSETNIDSLLMQRHTAKKIRMAGGRLKGPAKRAKEQDKAFEEKFRELLLKAQKSCQD